MPEPVVPDVQSNIGHICTRAQVDLGRGARVSMRWIPAAGEPRDYTFADLDAESNRFANALGAIGAVAGDVWFTYLPKCPEQFFSFLGALKRQVVIGTLFANFGEEALLDRLRDARAIGVVTKKGLLRKILKIRDGLPALRYVLVVDIDEHQSDAILSYPRLIAQTSGQYLAAPTHPDTPSVLHYTSGSTGKPKGVLHRHGGVVHQQQTTRDVLQLRSDDIFWCTADQGWVTGTSYGIIGPWSLGVKQVHYGGPYDANAWAELLEREQVTVWYTAPTALRMLMREDPSTYNERDLRRLRTIYSVGEPLNPEVIKWGRRVLGREIFDTWFQTETGGIMIANRPGLDVRPGSMGKPVAGLRAAVLGDDNREVKNGVRGNLCLEPGWPSMFTTYLHNPEVYAEKFRGGWYYTGDTAHRDDDGYFWFAGRSDDVINTAGHLVSPFEVESALLELPEIFESGVIGAPDDILFERVVAFVHLRPGYEMSRDLDLKIKLHVSNKVSTIASPREIIVTPSIPKNKAGKILRRILKARHQGADEGDTSTLET